VSGSLLKSLPQSRESGTDMQQYSKAGELVSCRVCPVEKLRLAADSCAVSTGQRRPATGASALAVVPKS
jgi:hypothetical protein